MRENNSRNFRNRILFILVFCFAFNMYNAHALMIENIGEAEKNLKVAGAKLSVSDNIETNIASIKKAIDFAREEGADILVTPEGSLSGYTADFDVKKAEKGLKEILAYASDAKIGLALGTCFYEPDGNWACPTEHKGVQYFVYTIELKD